MAWPAAGPSTTIRSAVPDRSSCAILPSTRMSRTPGMAVATASRIPELTRRLATRRMPWSTRYSTRASSAVRVRARIWADRLRLVRDSAGASSTSSPVHNRWPKAAFMPLLPSSSTNSTDRPWRAANLATAALTVVLPTPPLPVTTTTELWAHKAVMSM